MENKETVITSDGILVLNTSTKTLIEESPVNITNIEQAKAEISDIEVYGNGDLFQLISKASSKKQGWMKSTKAMELPGGGCVVQVTTQRKNPDGSYAVAEAITFVPVVRIYEDGNGNKYLA
jgi:hypothetical protein